MVTRQPALALAAVVVLEVVVFVAGQQDIVVSDPLWYANNAFRLATHPLDLLAGHDTHPFVMRVGLTAPLAALYRLFGVSTAVTGLPCLAAALAIVAIAYAAAPTPRAKRLAMLLCAGCVPLAQNAGVLNVDLPAAAWMAASVLCLSRRDRPGARAWLAAGVAAWFLGFLVKESALWCGVVWAYAIAIDLRTSGARRVVRAYLPAAVLGAALAAGYLAACAALWDDALARFHGIDALTDEHAWAFAGQPASAWLARLTWQPAWLFATMFRAALVPAILAAWLVRGRDRIWWVACAAFGLLYWLGTSSLSAYAPLPISPRMAVVVLPEVLAAGAIAADRALDRIARARLRTAVVVALAVTQLPAAWAIRALVARGQPERAAFDVIRSEVADPARQVVVVCGEPRCAAAGNFYFAFAIPPNLSIVFARDFAAAPRPSGATVRALVNHLRSPGARTTGQDLTGPIDALALPALAGDRNVRLYDAGDGAQLWAALRAAP